MSWRLSNRATPGRNTVTVRPTIEIEPEAYVRIQALVDQAPGEVSGFGLVEPAGSRLVVRAVFVPPQDCTDVSTDVEAGELASFLAELFSAGHDLARLRLWFHSHVDMPCYFSSIDRTTMANAFPHADWMLGLVVNRRGEMAASLQVERPVRFRIDGLPVRMYVPAEASAEAAAIIERAVRIVPMVADPPETGEVTTAVDEREVRP